MKCYVDKIIIATLCTLLALAGCSSSALALNVGTDWTDTDKSLSTTGDGTFGDDLTVGDDTTITGDLTVSGAVTLNTTKFNSKVVRSDYDYTSLTVAISSIGTTPTRLFICQDNIIADGTTITQPSTLTFDFTCGGSIDGVAGGGTETWVSNGYVIRGLTPIVGSNITTTFNVIQDITVDAVGDGVTDDADAIQTALNIASISAGSREVILGEKSYGIASKLSIPSGVKLVGIGSGQYPTSAYVASSYFIATPKTRLLALAGFPAATPMVEVATAAGAKYTHHSVNIKGIMIDCNLVADYGLKVVSVKNSSFEDILVFRPNLVGIIEDVLPIASATTEGNNATQFNNWKGVQVWAGTSASTTVGWQQTGTNSHNVNQSTYINCGVVSYHGDALQVIDADSNTWVGFRTYTFGKGVGVRLYGSDDAAAPSAFARLNIFLNPILGGSAHTGTAQAGAVSSITLASTASSDNEQYENRNIRITAGTGQGQVRNISAYTGSTKVAVVSVAWTTEPDSSSSYAIYSGGVVAQGGSTTNSRDNAMYGYHTSDGASEPIIDSGIRFTYTMAGGASYGWREFTPTITFATPGDLTVTYTTADGRYWRDGQTIKFIIQLACTPTFTTASGELRIGGLPYTALGVAYGIQYYPVTVHATDSRITWGTSCTMLTGRVTQGTTFIRLIGLGSGVISHIVEAADVNSGTATNIWIAGEYEAGA